MGAGGHRHRLAPRCLIKHMVCDKLVFCSGKMDLYIPLVRTGGRAPSSSPGGRAPASSSNGCAPLPSVAKIKKRPAATALPHQPPVKKRPAAASSGTPSSTNGTDTRPPNPRGTIYNHRMVAESANRHAGGSVPRVVTVCSGIESVIQAFEHVGLVHRHVAACDIDKHCRAVIQHNFHPNVVFSDVCEVKMNDVPDHDILFAGFPCQPFSRLGLSGGLQDKKGRGIIILHILRWIRIKRPKIVVLENVGDFANRHQEVLHAVLEMTRELGYYVEWKVLDTACFGLPQSRPRCWIVAVQRNALNRPLQWPTPSPSQCRDIDTLLGPRPTKYKVQRPKLTSDLNKNNVARIHQSLKAKGINAYQKTFICDIDCSARFFGNMKEGCSPCLTRHRAQCGGFWVTSHGRRLGTFDMLQLQGMSPSRLQKPDSVPIGSFNAMIGNAMSVNVVEALLSMLSKSCPGVFTKHVPDRWSWDGPRVAVPRGNGESANDSDDECCSS